MLLDDHTMPLALVSTHIAPFSIEGRDLKNEDLEILLIVQQTLFLGGAHTSI